MLYGYIPVAGWMRSELDLTDELLLAFAWIYQHYRLVKYDFRFDQMLEQMSPWFGSDTEKTIEIIEELDRRKVIEIERHLHNGQTYARLKINEPKINDEAED